MAWAGPCALASTACYTGLAGLPSGPAAATAADSGGGASNVGDDDGDGEGDDTDGPAVESVDPRQIRLLNAHEYRNTVRDLLGVEALPDLDFSDRGSGYDNGSNGQLGESLFGVLYLEAERLAAEYVATRLPQDFPCFDAVAPLAEACVETVVDELGRRAHRRPLDADARQGLLAFAAGAAEEADDSARVMELLVTRLLMSTRFLYRTEIGEAADADAETVELDPFERASLVSYTLTASMPDELLLADAEADQLDGDRIREHVRRLLATGAGRAQIVRFIGQWLRTQALDRMAAAPEEFAKFGTPELGESLRDELGAFIEHVVLDEKGTLADLLTRSLTYANRHTAPLYGLESTSDELEALELDPTQRGGVLTLASVMAVHSSGGDVARDKPIPRGLLVVNQLLCEEVGLPAGIDVQSAAAEVMDEVEDFDALTTREQFELIMNQDEHCVACHATFMPFGYLWSNFDALGQYQTHFGDRPLDSKVAGLLLDGATRDYTGVMDIIPELAQSEEVAYCLTTQMLRFVTGRMTGKTLTTVADELASASVQNERALTEIIEELLANPTLYIKETVDP